ncbi:hypothetical protein HN51_034013 [Arachis hypogaea]|uniref:Dirigent protein n=1 Tax=Arachis hypogaea TaxID=3818 RepID=A0A445A9Q2_ARAHY|nr:dirigent protein 24-like [Arachis ipaensis]XP_025641886.1 dirigent protein 24 [Arachis hypogaea]QHN98790.1 Dirigent protein [Arachis hypogaea]RYR23176.1 hypothetical protein Ahy_B03g068435 [Arachis hypogaea]
MAKNLALLNLFHLFFLLSYAKMDSITFFMHDILGGSTPSERIVAGAITNTQTTKIPFSKPNNRIIPMKGSIPIVDDSSSIVYASPTTVMVKDTGKNKVIIDKNNNNKNVPYVKPNQLPLGENLLFGRITVIDDEITKGVELGSEVIGKAQGFHVATSLDGSSRTMAFTAIFHNEKDDQEEEEDGVSFFGVHRTAAQESYLAVVGGTGKYSNAKGYAKIQTLLPPSIDQYITNGVETLLQITVYLSWI